MLSLKTCVWVKLSLNALSLLKLRANSWRLLPLPNNYLNSNREALLCPSTPNLRCLIFLLPWRKETLNLGARKLEIKCNLEMYLPLSKPIRLLWITKCKRKASLPISATLKERRMFLSEPPWLSWLMMKLISLLLLTGLKMVLLMPPLFNKKLFKLLPHKLLLPRLTILGTYSLRCLTSHLLWNL